MAKRKKKERRVRRQYKFWLNLVSDHEYAIAEQIEFLKRSRLFVGAVRDGLRLLISLRQGRADVLRELFPNIEEILGLSKIEPPPSSTPDNDIRGELEELKLLIRGRIDGYLPPSDIVAAPPLKPYRGDLPPKPANEPPPVDDGRSSEIFLDAFL